MPLLPLAFAVLLFSLSSSDHTRSPTRCMASSRNPGEVRDQPPPDTPGRAKNDKAPRSSRTRALQVDPRVDLSHRRGRVLASLEQFKDMLASLRRAQSRGGGDGRSSHQQAPCAPCPSPAVVILTAAEYAKGGLLCIDQVGVGLGLGD
jgi:hypothetical protein